MRLSKTPKRVRPQCLGCRHYYVTWETQHPHGCRAMGFKSQRPPYLEVSRSTPGVECLRFIARQ